jgi:hypothetical protein
VGVAAGSIAGARRSSFVAWAATLVAGAQLAVWGWIKRDDLTAAIVPTGAPDWFDRLATAAALAGGIGLVVVALVVLYVTMPRISGSTERSGSPHPARP